MSMDLSLFRLVRNDKPQAIQDQIREQVRDLIVAGMFEDGMRFPSTHVLAKLWKTHPSLVHSALVPLTKEGWLKRVNRVGTFVSRPEPRIERVGVYYPNESFLNAEHAFSCKLLFELARLLRAEGVGISTWMDPRPREEQRRSWPVLVEAVRERKIHALVVTATNWEYIRWLRHLAVPTAIMTSGNVPDQVAYDFGQFGALVLDALVRQGCKSVGLIALKGPGFTNPDGSKHMDTIFYQDFVDRATDLGLRIRNEWMRYSMQEIYPMSYHEQFGYEQFLALWSQPDRPEGLVVWPDTVAKGVILAVKKLGVDVPGSLKLVLHRNRGIPVFCPVPASFVESDAAEGAAALWKQVQRQFRGEAPKPIIIPFHPAPMEGRPATLPSHLLQLAGGSRHRA
jgi:DNA-binding LacI/PurR family transcriptional regulator